MDENHEDVREGPQFYASVRYYSEKKKIYYVEVEKIRGFRAINEIELCKPLYVKKDDPINGTEEFAPAMIFGISDNLDELKNPPKRPIRDARTESFIKSMLEKDENSQNPPVNEKKGKMQQQKEKADDAKVLKNAIKAQNEKDQEEIIAQKLKKLNAQALDFHDGPSCVNNERKAQESPRELSVFDISNQQMAGSYSLYEVKIRSLEQEVEKKNKIIQQLQLELSEANEQILLLQAQCDTMNHVASPRSNLHSTVSSHVFDDDDEYSNFVLSEKIVSSSKCINNEVEMNKENCSNYKKNDKQVNIRNCKDATESGKIPQVKGRVDTCHSTAGISTNNERKNDAPKRPLSDCSNLPPKKKNKMIKTHKQSIDSSEAEDCNEETKKIFGQKENSRKKFLSTEASSESESEDDHQKIKKPKKQKIKKYKKKRMSKKHKRYETSSSSSDDSDEIVIKKEKLIKKGKFPSTSKRASDKEYDSDLFEKPKRTEYKKWKKLLDNGKVVKMIHLKFGVSIRHSDWIDLHEINDSGTFLRALARAIFTENKLKNLAFKINRTTNRRDERVVFPPVEKAVLRKVFFMRVKMHEKIKEMKYYYIQNWKAILGSYISNLNQNELKSKPGASGSNTNSSKEHSEAQSTKSDAHSSRDKADEV